MKLNNTPNKKSKIFKVLLLFLPFFSVLILIIFKNFFINLKNILSPCLFREITGFYCPGCGNTRAVLALFNGDFLSSLRYNIAPLTIIILLILVYIEQVAKLFNKKIKLIPRSILFWIIIFILFIVYYVFRNFFPYFTPK